MMWLRSVCTKIASRGLSKAAGYKACVARSRALRLFVLLAPLLPLFSRDGCAQESTFDRDAYYRAVRYCRQNTLLGLDAITLSPDKAILCLDSTIDPGMNVSLASGLKENGLFVVRSPGGHATTAIALSDLIRDRHATVVVYDYCISACALFFLIASEQTYVLRNAVVAWHNPQASSAQPLCTFLTTPRDGESRKLQRGPCVDGGDQVVGNLPMMKQFFKDRTIDPSFEVPPDSVYVRRIVTNLYKETGVDREIAWTLHPRYYRGLFKTKIFYEAYPKSQDEVDSILASIGLNVKVIYDP